LKALKKKGLLAESAAAAERRPFHVIAKPAGPSCNLACTYCFYLSKKAIFPADSSFRMSDEVLERFTRQYIAAQPAGTPSVDFSWQGGEPALMGVDFFQRALGYQRKHARPGMQIANSLQTNGTLLNREWGEFLREHDFLVGISIDGPEEVHDRFRKKSGGDGSFPAVMEGLEVLRRHGVSFNTLTCVHAGNSTRPEEVYGFLKEIGSTFLQFIPVLEKNEKGGISSRSVAPDGYGRFLTAVFDKWLEDRDVGEIFVRDFEATLGLVMGLASPVCTYTPACGRSVVVEHDGDAFSCDHYVDDENRIGNVLTDTMAEMLASPKQSRFGAQKRGSLPGSCTRCAYLHLCGGGCPKDRVVREEEERPVNYLCEGYKRFFRHSVPVFEKMAACLRAGLPAGDYGKFIEHSRQTLHHRRQGAKSVGRNAPCPCGSGKKFKKCCL
jgi:uncharacterized protein